MTDCTRCDENFSNYFNGYHWCPSCGLVSKFDVSIKGKLEFMKK